MTDDLISFVENGVGRIRLNRPKAIHALTHEMCEGIIATLQTWRRDPSVMAVIIDHVDGRGFCAGGDIARIASSAKTDCAEADRFFELEYRMNHLLFVFEKPMVAFVDGIVMGGGVGLSMPCRYRVATEKTIFAMPETGIGLFSDVGAGWFLPRLPGRIGTWLASTGARIDGMDCVSIGLATHFIPSEQLEAVKAAIVANPADLSSILSRASEFARNSKLVARQDDIDRLFASDQVEDILAALRADGTEWALEQLRILESRSPQSVKVALRQMKEGASIPDFQSNMRKEFALAYRIIRLPDFVEGVRAVILDKDNAPRWRHATAAEVDHALIDSIFTPLPRELEWTPVPETERCYDL